KPAASPRRQRLTANNPKPIPERSSPAASGWPGPDPCCGASTGRPLKAAGEWEIPAALRAHSGTTPRQTGPARSAAGRSQRPLVPLSSNGGYADRSPDATHGGTVPHLQSPAPVPGRTPAHDAGPDRFPASTAGPPGDGRGASGRPDGLP